MTLSLKGFITNTELTNNTPGVIARFGELSTHCRTFAKDVQTLTNGTFPTINVAVFSHHSTANTIPVKVNNVFSDLVIEISAWLHSTSTAFNATTTQLDVVAALTNRFSSYITNASVSPLIGNFGKYLPARIQATVNINSFEELSIVLWTANAEFESGYDEYEIVIVPPVDNVDVYMGAFTAVTEQMLIVNPVRDFQRIESTIAKKPPTHNVAVAINWVDPTQPTRKINTTWYALIYGSRGNTADAINEALRRYILSISTSPEFNWRIVMPDLFRITRFLLAPLWNSLAISGRTSVAGIYTPVASMSEINQVVTSVTNSSGINKLNFELFSHPFRSISIIVLAGSDNKAGAETLRLCVPDYIASESTEEDFNRQAATTQVFSNLIGMLVRSAESYKPGFIQAVGIRVVVFDGYTCLASKHDGIEYLIRTKLQNV